MKKVLFNIIIPAFVLAIWMITCYYPCAKPEGFDWFLYWIMVGCPYGMRKMCMFLVPQNFGISGGFAVLAMNFVIGGMIGGFVAIGKMIKISNGLIEVLLVTFGHFVQK